MTKRIRTETLSPAAVESTLGELIAQVYEELLALYGDEDIASVATAAIINDMVTRPEEVEALVDAA